MKKRILSILFALVICLSVPVIASAASESLENGKAAWYGGISDNTIYSKVWDRKNDNIRFHAKVWTENKQGTRCEEEDDTYDVDEAGEIIVTQAATSSLNPFATNKCGYDNFYSFPKD